MALCFDCQLDAGMAGENDARWQFATELGPCDRCGAKYAHRRRFTFEGDGDGVESCQ